MICGHDVMNEHRSVTHVHVHNKHNYQPIILRYAAIEQMSKYSSAW